MANDQLYKEYMTSRTAQTSDAISASSFSNGTQLVLDQCSASANCRGAWEADCYIDVTVAPSAETTLQVWAEVSNDGSTYTAAINTGCSVDVSTTGKFFAGTVKLHQYQKFSIKAGTYGCTASLTVEPSVPEVNVVNE